MGLLHYYKNSPLHFKVLDPRLNRLLKSEPSIVKLIENESDLSKLFTLSEPSIVKFIENQSEHFSKLTLYHLKKCATRRSRRAREPSRIPLLFLRGLKKKNSMLKKFVFTNISTIEIPKPSKLHRYVNKMRKLYHARYKCNNKRDPKIINLNKMAIPKKAYLLSFFSRQYHKIMKLKCKARRYLSLFSCNCVSHMTNYVNFKLSKDVEKNPEPTQYNTDHHEVIIRPFMQNYSSTMQLDLPQVDLMNFRVEYVSYEQDDGLFRKSTMQLTTSPIFSENLMRSRCLIEYNARSHSRI